MIKNKEGVSDRDHFESRLVGRSRRGTAKINLEFKPSIVQENVANNEVGGNALQGKVVHVVSPDSTPFNPSRDGIKGDEKTWSL